MNGSVWFKGYSLIELLVTLCVAGLLACLSSAISPSLLKKNQVQVTADEIKQAFQLAKIQALASHQTLTLAPFSADGNWSDGMRLFVDTPIHSSESSAVIIREWDWSSRHIGVSWHGFESNQYVRFSADLFERSASGRFVIDDHQHHAIQLSVNRLARVRYS